MMPDLIVFDLDKTLARSKQPLDETMATLLTKLLTRTRVAIISGGAFHQFESQVIARLPANAAYENLFILPTSGGALYEWKEGSWNSVYEERIPEQETIRIEEVIRAAGEATGLVDFSTDSFGRRIENRGAQVTLSALGQQAPLEAKEAWDPDGTKKRTLRAALEKMLPEYDVKSGGSTSIDVTRRGVNKAFGIRRLSGHLTIPIEHMQYVGDALYPGGNDEVVKETGIKTRAVQDPSETEEFIRQLVAK